MEETVGNIRRELWVWQDNLKGYRHKIIDVYRKGFSKVDCPEKSNGRNHLDGGFEEKANQPQACPEAKKSFRSPWSVPQKFEKICLDRCGRPCSGEHKHHTFVDYLREPTHGPHRVGAILLSGITGYILGMRRSRLRRLFYGTFGILGMTAVCYPEETLDHFESIVLEGRRYFIVAYHFVYGETPKVPEWLEKFTGPLRGTEGETGPSETSSESSKIKPSEENVKSAKEKKT